ncbi:MAG: hypothetical protein GY751_17690 [Bacteroidetes bacterium]|nr:hypothetical protein [Bacteroidota bacterium]
MTVASRKDGYTRTSIIIHWLSVIAVIALFFTHEGDRGSQAYMFHVGGGAIIGVFLLWRVFHRLARGMTEKPKQHFIFNLASSLTMWGLLAAIVTVVLTGYLVPWTRGLEIDVFNLFSIPSPLNSNRDLHELAEEIHEIAGQSLLPLVLLHIVGALKHALFDRDNIVQRMKNAIAGGR